MPCVWWSRRMTAAAPSRRAARTGSPRAWARLARAPDDAVQQRDGRLVIRRVRAQPQVRPQHEFFIPELMRVRRGLAISLEALNDIALGVSQRCQGEHGVYARGF